MTAYFAWHIYRTFLEMRKPICDPAQTAVAYKGCMLCGTSLQDDHVHGVSWVASAEKINPVT